MDIRKIEGTERFDAYLISSFCFHSRVEYGDEEWTNTLWRSGNEIHKLENS